ncbi:MAG: transglutaminase family protein [Pseudomonadota bacterium]
MTIEMTVTVPARPGTLIAPAGLSTPAATSLGVDVSGASCVGHDMPCGQSVLEMQAKADQITLRYAFEVRAAEMPDEAFAPRDSRFTRAADALAAEAQQIVAAHGLTGFVDHVTQLFHYGHGAAFYDGADEMPQLCDMQTGSCVDINAYLIAGLRAAGVEAGYVTGYFIPEARRDHTTDMHCWVVTRQGGAVQHWDIAHHLKLGTRDVRPSLNPKPGVRVAMSHSMGWTLPALGLKDTKLLAEPIWQTEDGWEECAGTFTLEGYDALDAAQNRALVS